MLDSGFPGKFGFSAVAESNRANGGDHGAGGVTWQAAYHRMSILQVGKA